MAEHGFRQSKATPPLEDVSKPVSLGIVPQGEDPLFTGNFQGDSFNIGGGFSPTFDGNRFLLGGNVDPVNLPLGLGQLSGGLELESFINGSTGEVVNTPTLLGNYNIGELGLGGGVTVLPGDNQTNINASLPVAGGVGSIGLVNPLSSNPSLAAQFNKGDFSAGLGLNVNKDNFKDSSVNGNINYSF